MTSDSILTIFIVLRLVVLTILFNSTDLSSSHKTVYIHLMMIIQIYKLIN